MTAGTIGLLAIVAGFAGGGAVAALAPSDRSARIATLVGAAIGCLGGVTLSASVMLTGRPTIAHLPSLVSPAGGIAIELDRLGALFLALVSAAGLAAAIYGFQYTREYSGRSSLRVFGLMFNGFLFGMSIVTCAANIFTFLLAWEVMALTSYFLVMTDSGNPETREAGLWYIAMAHFAFVLLLPMFLLMAPTAAATTFADLRTGAKALPQGTRDAVFLLALVAFGSKAGIVPLHVWLPRAHPAAPSHISALMSGVMIKLGIYGLLRVAFDLMHGGPAWWGGLLLAVGSVSALLGVLYALMEHDLKRLLAYHSVENIGIILIGIGAGAILNGFGLHALATIGFAGALFHTVNHASFKALLFLGAGSVIQQTHTGNMEELGGLIKRMPQTAFLFLVGSAAIAALPPLNGFASEWLVFQSLLAGTHIPRPDVAIGFPIAVGILALTSGLAAACFVKAFGISFLAMPRSDHAAQAQEPHWSMRAAMWLLAGSCVVFGVAAPTVIGALNRTINSIPGLSTGAGNPPVPHLWLTMPDGVTRMSPLLMAALTGGVALLAVLAVQLHGLRIRRADTWGCGRISQTPRMEYTASAFAEPLRRVFAELYRPTEDLTVSVHADSPYFVRSITYTSHVVPWFEKAFYDPVAGGAVRLAMWVRRLQGGSVHLYLLYVATALVTALAAAWWYR